MDAKRKLRGLLERELPKRIDSGMFDFAVRSMGADLARYLEAGLQNCIDHVKVLIENPWRGELRMAAISKAEFFIPLKFSRRVEHHRDWPLYLSEYEAALKVAQEVRLKARRNFANRAMTIAQKFPGITDKMARRLAAKGSMP